MSAWGTFGSFTAVPQMLGMVASQWMGTGVAHLPSAGQVLRHYGQ
jgi:hypothetical protein